jgi:uridine kinase
MNLEPIIEIIFTKRRKMPEERSLLVGISGIDASGKGLVTTKLAEQIRQKGLKVAVINVDGWLNLPHIRFNPQNPAQNFYENALRLEEMFERLVLPLKESRSLSLTADFAEETAAEYRKHEYFYEDIDIILLEGIFLFKNEFVKHFDARFWIECFFETALRRAVRRAQENLSPADTVRAYESIYFPAQRMHFRRDRPQDSADLIWFNN